jgi:predicted GTPase
MYQSYNQNEIPVVIVIGATGVGKSTVCNVLSGDTSRTKYPESADIKPETFKTTIEEVYWFGEESNDKLLLIDTPGLGDPQNKDFDN